MVASLYGVEQEHKVIWIYLEHAGGSLESVSLELLAKGRSMADELGWELHGLILGQAVEPLVAQAYAHQADYVWLVEHPLLERFTVEGYSHAAFEAIMQGKPSVLLFGATPDGRDLAARLAVRLRTGLNADCTGLYMDAKGDLLVSEVSGFGGGGLSLLAALFMSFLLLGRLTIPGHTVIPYLYPLMAYGLLVTSLFRAEVALITVLPLSLFVAYGLPNALDLVMYYTISSYFGILALGRGQRVTSFVRAGGTIAVVGSITAVAFRFMDPNADLVGLLTLTASAVGNGIASASISIVLQFLLAQLLGMTTALQLIDISRPDHPLMQFILRNAPGTYQHSLQLANLVEQAAERIGADPLLSRVGALYHDAGKALNPYFFIENQVAGNLNPHDHITPEASAAIIRQHITDGVDLAQRYRLPPRIQDFIKEHHGTMITSYQYHKALEAAGDKNDVDIECFRYPGPRPRSRETALMMLADGCEARMRAEKPNNEDELRDLIEDVINRRLKMEQLKETDLTFKDLEEIINSFIATLRGVYHPRIEYPKVLADVVKNEQSMPQSVSEEKPTQPTESASSS